MVAEDLPANRKALAEMDTSGCLFWPSNPEGVAVEPEQLQGSGCRLDGNVAFLQMTSGSTGSGKLLAIGHANIFANTRGIRSAGKLGSDEIGISWLPLYHDMGLVGAELFCFIHGYPLVLMTPQDFLRKPGRWLDGMSRFECTMAVTANFGLDYCVRMLSDSISGQFDLSALKTMFCGAEPIRRRTLVDFAEKFQRSGFHLDRFLPCYGMAETTLASTIRRPSEPLSFLTVDRHRVAIGEPVQLLEEKTGGDSRCLDLVSLGRAIDGASVEILGEAGESLPEGVCGEIVISGSSVGLGYLNQEGHVSKAFREQRVYSGDLGFLWDGQLYIIDRMKSIIVYNGANYSCADLEEQVAAIVGTTVDRIAVFEQDINTQGTPNIVLLIDGGGGIQKERIEEAIPRLTGSTPPIARVVLGRRRVIPRTTSGKKRYMECRKLLTDCEFETVLDLDIGIAPPPALRVKRKRSFQAVVPNPGRIGQAGPRVQAMRSLRPWPIP